MEFLLLIISVINLLIVIGIANAIVRLFPGKYDEEVKNDYASGYSEGGLDMMYFIKGNLVKHREILPDWLPDWLDKMIISYRKKQEDNGLSDLPIKYSKQPDYSNILEQSKISSDIKLIKDE